MFTLERILPASVSHVDQLRPLSLRVSDKAIMGRVSALRSLATSAKRAKPIVNAAAKPDSEAKARSLKNSGLLKPAPLSPALKKFVGTSEMSRTEVMKKVWEYIKEKNLQDPNSRREIVCDDTLKQLFPDKERLYFTEIAKGLVPHFLKKT